MDAFRRPITTPARWTHRSNTRMAARRVLLRMLALAGVGLLVAASSASASTTASVVQPLTAGIKDSTKAPPQLVITRRTSLPSSSLGRLARTRGGAAAAATKAAPAGLAPPPGTSSLTASIVNLAKNIIGGGMLALPAGLAAGAGTGYLPAYLLLAFSALSSAYTFVLVGRSVEATKARSFKEAWSRTVGPSQAWVVDYAITALAFGICIVYACFVGDTFTSLLKGAGLPPALSSRSASILGVTALVLFPLTLLRDLSSLQYSSYVGIAAVLYTVLFIAKRFYDGSYAPGAELYQAIPNELRPKPAAFGTWQVSAGTAILFSMFSTSYMAHTNAVKFYNELKDRSVSRFAQVVGVAMGAATVIYLAVMTLGFESFGLNAQGLVLNNYHVSKDLLATLGRVATAISIIGAHPLLFSGLRDSFLNVLPPSVAANPSAWLGSTVLLLGGATFVALLCQDVGLIVSLVGSSLGAAIVYVFPPLMYLHLLRKRKDLPRSTGEVLLLHATILFGAVSGVLGTYITLSGA